MAIITNIDVMLAKRKMSVTELANKVGITIVNLSRIKQGNVKGIRYSTLNRICEALAHFSDKTIAPHSIASYSLPFNW